MANELLNAGFGELLPPVSVSTSSSSVTFTAIGNNMKDVILSNTGASGCIVSINASAVVPSSVPVQNSVFIAAGAIVTVRKGLNVSLSFICPTGSTTIWAQATNGA